MNVRSPPSNSATISNSSQLVDGEWVLPCEDTCSDNSVGEAEECHTCYGKVYPTTSPAEVPPPPTSSAPTPMTPSPTPPTDTAPPTIPSTARPTGKPATTSPTQFPSFFTPSPLTPSPPTPTCATPTPMTIPSTTASPTGEPDCCATFDCVDNPDFPPGGSACADVLASVEVSSCEKRSDELRGQAYATSVRNLAAADSFALRSSQEDPTFSCSDFLILLLPAILEECPNACGVCASVPTSVPSQAPTPAAKVVGAKPSSSTTTIALAATGSILGVVALSYGIRALRSRRKSTRAAHPIGEAVGPEDFEDEAISASDLDTLPLTPRKSHTTHLSVERFW